MPNQSSSIAPVDIGNNTTITPEFSTNQLNDEFVFNYCRTTIINILRERIDVENDSRLFTLTLYMIQFIPDRTVRDIYTTTSYKNVQTSKGNY